MQHMCCRQHSTHLSDLTVSTALGAARSVVRLLPGLPSPTQMTAHKLSTVGGSHAVLC
jgi:hypothetical protein